LPAFVADTLFVDTDRQIATLTFRAIVPVDNDKIVVNVMAGDPDDEETDCAAMATAELDRSVINGSANALPNDYTTELDRSAFREALSMGLPFAPSSDPGRSSAPNTADGALPFRPTPPSRPSVRQISPPPLSPPPPAPPPPAAAPLSPPPPPSSPRPSSPKQAPSVLPPPPPLVTAPLASNSKDALRNELGDRFRKAFGLAAAPEPAAPSPMTTPSSPPPFVPSSPPPFVPSSPPPFVPSSPPLAVLGTKPASDAVPSTSLPGSVRAASDAAAASVVASEARALASMASPLEPKREGSLGAPSFARRAVVDLLSFEPTVPGRLRRSPAHAPVLAAVPPARVHQQVDVAPGEQSAEDRARIDILRVLSCGTPLGTDEINHAFDALLDDPYDFDIPLFLVEGDVKPTMDEVETLRVATELAKPLAGASKRMQAAIAAATEALSRTAPPVPESAITLYKQLESATSEASLPPRHLADLVERTLREARSFKKRTLMGSPRIRADLTIGKITLPLYLPEPAASQLPLLPAFPLVALVELRPREDASEQNAAALVALALGRVLRSRK
ncbi:MAG: hypothetical protein HOV80_33845, partial [Polyangiaceae bacterium]|nr:hypothetical protein [Polyangiaceae bacterium]